MNNFTFGDTFGYYETIGGGSGAGPMTNARITDAEILKRRYPVILRQFCLRDDSSGKGEYNGGEGCIRTVQFCKELFVSILSERRSYLPYGLNGGTNAKSGVGLIRRAKDNYNIMY